MVKFIKYESNKTTLNSVTSVISYKVACYMLFLPKRAKVLFFILQRLN